jgi:hypothetical protein
MNFKWTRSNHSRGRQCLPLLVYNLTERNFTVNITKISAAILVVLFLFTAIPTYAAPAQPGVCAYNLQPQNDRAGYYVSDTEAMAVEVFPCGGIMVTWDDTLNRPRNAGYITKKVLQGGGYIAALADEWDIGLDGKYTITVKPAERGWIQVMTINQYGQDQRVHRLRRL